MQLHTRRIAVASTFGAIIYATALISSAGAQMPAPAGPWDRAATGATVDVASPNDRSKLDGAEFPMQEMPGSPVSYVHPAPSIWMKMAETPPAVLTWPHEPIAKLFARLLNAEHDEVETRLEEVPLGIQPVDARPPLLFEWNERFLAPDWLNQGVELPTGAVWRPSIWTFGTYRSAVQYFDSDRGSDPVVEWANRLDLFTQLNLTATERLLVGLRPLDEERGDRRVFSGYDFNDGETTDGWNADFQTLFFEGDFGEIFPFLDPYDHRMLDYGFSVGRMPILAQQGLLINEDMVDAVSVTRNTLHGLGNLNARIAAVYAWNAINRNSPLGRPNTYDPSSRMFALLTEHDFHRRTVLLDYVRVTGDDSFSGDLHAFGIGSTRRWYGHQNTYNSSIHLLASFPDTDRTSFADQGELIFGQFSWTPHHTEDLIYLNAFWAIDQFTSPARGPLQGGPLGRTGLLFSAPGVGRYGAPVGIVTNNRAGAALGYQMFYDHLRKQVVWELAGHKETKGPSSGAVATGVTYQSAFGQHLIFLASGFVGKEEGERLSQGARTEFVIKF